MAEDVDDWDGAGLGEVAELVLHADFFEDQFGILWSRVECFVEWGEEVEFAGDSVEVWFGECEAGGFGEEWGAFEARVGAAELGCD